MRMAKSDMKCVKSEKWHGVRTTVGSWGETMNKIHVKSETNESCNQSTKLGKNGNIFKAHVKFTCYYKARLPSLPTCYATHVLQIVMQQGWTLNKVTCSIGI
jgi:hypothetical protein